MKQQEVVGDFDPENYESERFFVTVRDGVQVPVSIVYRKGYQKTVTRRCSNMLMAVTDTVWNLISVLSD